MDPMIWGSLPDELLERVLCFLPMKTAITLRPTCKRFKSFISTTSFVSKLDSPSFIVLFHPNFHNHLLLYNSLSDTWRTSFISLPNSPPCSSSSNGLLCFSIPNSSSFFIFNLLSQSSKLIRFPSTFSFKILSLLSNLNGFNIFAIPTGSNSPIFLYDSIADSWTRFPINHPISTDHTHQQGVCHNDTLYFTTSNPLSVVSFHLKTGLLGRPDAHLPQDLVFLRLVRDQGDSGRVYMVGGVGMDGISRSLKVWEMEDGGGNWVEMGTLPEMMYRKFMCVVCYHNYENVYCFWHQGMVCICCSTWPEILYFRVSRRTWHWLSKCPSLPDKWRCGFRWFSFVPKLCLSV